MTNELPGFPLGPAASPPPDRDGELRAAVDAGPGAA